MRWTGVQPGSSVARRLEWARFTHEQAARGLGCYFVVTVDEEVAGAADVRLVDREDPRIGELGYLLAAPFRGRGVMSSALSLLVEWSFAGPPRLERVQALVHPDNEGSSAVLARLGFVCEGLLRSFRAAGPGRREDREMWSLLPIDWRAS